MKPPPRFIILQMEVYHFLEVVACRPQERYFWPPKIFTTQGTALSTTLYPIPIHEGEPKPGGNHSQMLRGIGFLYPYDRYKWSEITLHQWPKTNGFACYVFHPPHSFYKLPNWFSGAHLTNNSRPLGCPWNLVTT